MMKAKNLSLIFLLIMHANVQYASTTTPPAAKNTTADAAALLFPADMPTHSINEKIIDQIYGASGLKIAANDLASIKKCYCYLEFLVKIDKVKNDPQYTQYKSDFKNFLQPNPSNAPLKPTQALIDSKGWGAIQINAQDIVNSAAWQIFCKTVIADILYNDALFIVNAKEGNDQLFPYLPSIEQAYSQDDFTKLRLYEEVIQLQGLMQFEQKNRYAAQCNDWKSMDSNKLFTAVTQFTTTDFYNFTHNPQAIQPIKDPKTGASTPVIIPSPLREQILCYSMLIQIQLTVHDLMAQNNDQSTLTQISSSELSPNFIFYNASDFVYMDDLFTLQNLQAQNKAHPKKPLLPMTVPTSNQAAAQSSGSSNNVRIQAINTPTQTDPAQAAASIFAQLPTVSIYQAALDQIYGPSGLNIPADQLTNLKRTYCYLEYLVKVDKVRNDPKFAQYQQTDFKPFAQAGMTTIPMPTQALVTSNAWQSIKITQADISASPAWQNFIKAMICDCMDNETTFILKNKAINDQILPYLPNIETAYTTNDFTSMRLYTESIQLYALMQEDQRKRYLQQCSDWKSIDPTTMSYAITIFKQSDFYINTHSQQNAATTKTPIAFTTAEQITAYFLLITTQTNIFGMLTLNNLASFLQQGNSVELASNLLTYNSSDFIYLNDYLSLRDLLAQNKANPIVSSITMKATPASQVAVQSLKNTDDEVIIQNFWGDVGHALDPSKNNFNNTFDPNKNGFRAALKKSFMAMDTGLFAFSDALATGLIEISSDITLVACGFASIFPGTHIDPFAERDACKADMDKHKSVISTVLGTVFTYTAAIMVICMTAGAATPLVVGMFAGSMISDSRVSSGVMTDMMVMMMPIMQGMAVMTAEFTTGFINFSVGLTIMAYSIAHVFDPKINVQQQADRVKAKMEANTSGLNIAMSVFITVAMTVAIMVLTAGTGWAAAVYLDSVALSAEAAATAAEAAAAAAEGTEMAGAAANVGNTAATVAEAADVANLVDAGATVGETAETGATVGDTATVSNTADTGATVSETGETANTTKNFSQATQDLRATANTAKTTANNARIAAWAAKGVDVTTVSSNLAVGNGTVIAGGVGVSAGALSAASTVATENAAAATAAEVAAQATLAAAKIAAEEAEALAMTETATATMKEAAVQAADELTIAMTKQVAATAVKQAADTAAKEAADLVTQATAKEAAQQASVAAAKDLAAKKLAETAAKTAFDNGEQGASKALAEAIAKRQAAELLAQQTTKEAGVETTKFAVLQTQQAADQAAAKAAAQAATKQASLFEKAGTTISNISNSIGKSISTTLGRSGTESAGTADQIAAKKAADIAVQKTTENLAAKQATKDAADLALQQTQKVVLEAQANVAESPDDPALLLAARQAADDVAVKQTELDAANQALVKASAEQTTAEQTAAEQAGIKEFADQATKNAADATAKNSARLAARTMYQKALEDGFWTALGNETIFNTTFVIGQALNAGFSVFGIMGAIAQDQAAAQQVEQEQQSIETLWRFVEDSKVSSTQTQNLFLDELHKKHQVAIENQAFGLQYYKNFLNGSVDVVQNQIAQALAQEYIQMLTPDSNGLRSADIGSSWGLQTPFTYLYPAQGFASTTLGRPDFPYAQEIAQAPLASETQGAAVDLSDNQAAATKLWFNQRAVSTVNQPVGQPLNVEIKFRIIYNLTTAYHVGLYLGGNYHDHESAAYLQSIQDQGSIDIDEAHLAKMFVLKRDDANSAPSVGLYENEGMGWITQQPVDPTILNTASVYHMSAKLDKNQLTIAFWSEDKPAAKWSQTTTVTACDQRTFGVIFSGLAIEWGVVQPTQPITQNKTARVASNGQSEADREKASKAQWKQLLNPKFGSMSMQSAGRPALLQGQYLYTTQSTGLMNVQGNPITDYVVFATSTAGNTINIGGSPAPSDVSQTPNAIISLITGNVYNSSNKVIAHKQNALDAYAQKNSSIPLALAQSIIKAGQDYQQQLLNFTFGSYQLTALSAADINLGIFIYTCPTTITTLDASGRPILDYLIMADIVNNMLGSTVGMPPSSSVKGMISLVTGNVYGKTSTTPIDSGYSEMAQYLKQYSQLPSADVATISAAAKAYSNATSSQAQAEKQLTVSVIASQTISFTDLLNALPPSTGGMQVGLSSAAPSNIVATQSSISQLQSSAAGSASMQISGFGPIGLSFGGPATNDTNSSPVTYTVTAPPTGTTIATSNLITNTITPATQSTTITSTTANITPSTQQTPTNVKPQSPPPALNNNDFVLVGSSGFSF